MDPRTNGLSSRIGSSLRRVGDENLVELNARLLAGEEIPNPIEAPFGQTNGVRILGNDRDAI